MKPKALAAQRFLANYQPRALGDEGVDLPCLDDESIDDISRLLARVTEGDSDERLIAALNELVGDREEIEKAVIVWVDLIEVLVEAAEGRYPEKGRGGLKKEEVKGVIIYLLRVGRFELPRVPDYLQPVVTDVIADFTVDAIVTLTNDYRLWSARPAAGVTPADVWHRIKRAVLLVLRPLATLLGRIGSRIYLALRYPARVSPALRTALAAVERDGLIARGKTPLERKLEVLLWVGQNRDAFVAGVQLVGLVAEEVEQFVSLDSADKKRCARELVFSVLEEAGFAPRSQLLQAKLATAVDAAIEGVVYLFTKRGLFAHKKPSRERSGPVATLRAPAPPLPL
jgi:hypothetical protein